MVVGILNGSEITFYRGLQEIKQSLAWLSGDWRGKKKFKFRNCKEPIF